MLWVLLPRQRALLAHSGWPEPHCRSPEHRPRVPNHFPHEPGLHQLVGQLPQPWVCRLRRR